MFRAPNPIARLVCLACLLTVSASGSLLADGVVEEVRSYQRAPWLLAELRVRDLLDERTSSTIDSGLPGTCVYHIRLEDDSANVVDERFLEMSLRHDLWENHYLLDGPGGLSTFPSIAEADSAWSHLRDVVICATKRLDPTKRYRIQVEVAVQPLGPTERERLSKYVSGSSSQRNGEVALDVGAFLGRLLANSSGSEDFVRFTGPYFQIGDLEIEE